MQGMKIWPFGSLKFHTQTKDNETIQHNKAKDIEIKENGVKHRF